MLKKWAIIISILSILMLVLSGIVQILKEVNELPIDNNTLFEVTYSYFVDENREFKPGTIISNLEHFTETSFNKARVDFGEAKYWYLLSIKNVGRQNQSIAVLLDNPMLDYIDVYKLSEEKLTNILSAGDHRRPINLADIAFPNIRLVIEPNETLQLLIETTSTGAPYLPLALFLEEDFVKYENAIHIIWGAFIGIVVLMALYNLILYSGVKDTLYLLYVGYILCFLIVLGIVHGFASYIMPFNLQLIVSQKIIVLFCLVSFFMLAFAYKFLKFDEEPKRIISRITRIVRAATLVLAVLSFFLIEYIAAQLFFILQGFIYLTAIMMIGTKIRLNMNWAKFYIISWFPLFIGAAVGPLMLTGNLEYNFWTRHALLFGVMFEMTFISMALAERLRQSESDRLYQANHDHVFGFANSNVLEKISSRLLESDRRKSLFMVAISITKYDSMIPYLTHLDLKNLVCKFVLDIQKDLSKQLMLVGLDQKSEFPNFVMIREGVFTVLISSDDAILVTEVLKQLALNQPKIYALEKLSISLRYKLGVASFDDFSDTSEMINKAQQAIDIAVERNLAFYLYARNTKSEEWRRVKLASELPNAIRNNELELHHQPQLCIQSGTIVGSEVLTRWKHKELGYIPADEFVTIAENTGLINELSKWVFDKSCEHLCLLHEKGLKNHRISVNFSAHDVVLDKFTAILEKSLSRHNVKASQFTLELTETAFVADATNFSANLKELKELGFKISMDDFGTGYSSLSYISQHPFDELKIDKSFILSLVSSSKDKLIVNAILSLAESLDYVVVAEGIESEGALDYLKSKGCHIGQGYLFSRPQTIDNFFDWMGQHQQWKHLPQIDCRADTRFNCSAGG